MEKCDAVGGAANVGENAPIAGASNGSLAGQHADRASQIADLAADRSVKLQDRGETIEDIISELNATSHKAVPPPAETSEVPAEESDKDSTCGRKTESIASSGCGADALEDDIDKSGADPEPRISEMEDDFIVADEASSDEVAILEDSAAKDEKEEDHAQIPTAPENNAKEENEGSETAVSSENAGDPVVAKTVEVTQQLNSEDKPTAGSLESDSVEESKMPSVPEKPGGNASEVPGTPRRTGRQRNAPQRLVDSAEKRVPERRHNGHEKPAVEGATTSLTVDQNSHAETVPNGDGSPVGQTNKTLPKRPHLTKAQRKLMIEDEAPALPKQTTPRKRVNKLPLEEAAVPSEASGNIQAEPFSDDQTPLAQRKTKASPRSKSLAKVRSQLPPEDQTSATPKKGTPRKRAAKPVAEEVLHEASTNGEQPDVFSDDDIPLAVRKTRGSPRAKQPSTSPKKTTPGKRTAKATMEGVLHAETTATDDQAGVFSDEDVPLAKRRNKPSPKGKTPSKVRKQLALDEPPSASSKQGAQREPAAKLISGAVALSAASSSSSLKPDLLSEDDVPLAIRKSKVSPKKKAVKVREQVGLEEQPQASSSRAAPRKRPSKADADLEVPSPGKDNEAKTRSKRQRTTAGKDPQVSAAPTLETQSNEKPKSSAAKAKRTAAKGTAASGKTVQIDGSSDEPGEEPMEQSHAVQKEQDTSEADAGLLQQEYHTESLFSSSRPRCIPAPPWRAEEFVSSDRLLRESVCLGLRGREVTTGPAFLTIEVPSSDLVPRRCWGPKSARRRPTVVFGGCDPYKMYVNVHGTRVLLQQWSRAANITPSVRLTDMFAAFSSE
ncbi:unnamed protein product [Ixodes hexagonus]